MPKITIDFQLSSREMHDDKFNFNSHENKDVRRRFSGWAGEVGWCDEGQRYAVSLWACFGGY